MEYIKESNEIVIRKNDYLRLDTGFYKYIGNVKTIHEVPDTDCLFSMDGLLYIRKVDLKRIQMIKMANKPKEIDDSEELNLTVNPGDDSTLIIIKELLKGFTKNSFRKLFDNDSDMNNMRRAIEKSPNGQLSLNRFRMILEKLGLRYKIIVYAAEEAKTNKENQEYNFDEIINEINSRTLDGEEIKTNVKTDESED